MSRGVLVENGRELPHRHLVLDDREAVLAVLRGEYGVSGGVAVPFSDFVEGNRTFPLADRHLKIDVARALFAELHAVH